MDNFTATEIAYKNGYNQALKDFAERLDKEVEGTKGYETFGASYIQYWQVFDCISKITKEMEKDLKNK